MGKNLMPLLAAGGLAALTMGGATPAIAAAEGGATAGGAAAGAGALGASDALAAQGAAGLLGSAGAEAAGYGSGSLLAGGMSPIAAVEGAEVAPMTAEIDGATQTGFQGLDGTQYWGNSITDGTGMTANSYTGGYDSLNGLERMGQRVQGAFEGGGSHGVGNIRQLIGSQQQPQQQRPMSGGAPRRPMQMQQDTPTVNPYGLLMDANQQEEVKRRMGGY